ncbi:MAG: serine hydrolase domain-containing protein [Flavobacteriales bacterium]
MRCLSLPLGIMALATAGAQTLQQQLQAIATQRGLVGMSVVALCGEEVTHAVHTGQRNLAQGWPVNDATRYRIASISKLVTAIGLLKLHEQGAFQLDDDVSAALGFTLRNPQHPSAPITYRMLLTHRSSLQDGTGYGNFLTATYSSAPPPPISQLVVPGGTWYTANLWRSEAPGTYFVYSNLNYGVIGTLIEALSGQRFDLYMRQQVLLPLGIAGSFNVQDLDDIAQLATLYRNSAPQADNFNGVMPPAPNLGAYVIGTNGLYFAPQGGLRCSALELAQVAKLLLGNGTVDGNTILAPATTDLILSNQWTWDGSNGDNYYGLFRSWGLGAHRITAQPGGDVVLPGLPMFGHAGEAYGLISDLYVDTLSGFGLVFITNGYTPGNSYALGVSSAFYRVEEEVYAALGAHGYAACAATGSNESGPRQDLLAEGRKARWTGAGALRCEAFDATGRLLERFVLEPGRTWTAPDVVAAVFLRCEDASGRRFTARLQ